MKKALSIFLVVALLAISLVGCDSATEQPQTPPATPDSGAKPDAEKPAAPEADGGIAKIGLGHVISIGKSKSLEGETTPLAQVDNTIAAVGFDKDGKIVKVTVDVAQTKVTFDKDLKLTSDVAADNKSKVELGDAYGMVGASSIGKEWYQQMAEFEKWMTGKTVDEVKALKVKERDASHKAVPDVPELASTVTITVESYIAAVEEAYQNAVAVEAGVEKLGLGHGISIGKSKGLDGDKGPLAQVDTTIAATAFDASGKVVGTVVDVAQTKVQFDTDGKLTTDLSAELKTKKELGDAYGMVGASSIGKEWYQQMAEFEKWMAGKTVSEINSLKVMERDASHKAVPDVPELASTVTITVESYQAAVEESYANAK